MYQHIGFIGSGNMGGALAIAAAKFTKNITLSNRTPSKAEALAKELGVHYDTNEEIAQKCDLIFLGVKPHLVAGLMKSIEDILAARTDSFVLVSMAAGVTMDALEAMTGKPYPIIRIMPNTPVAVGKGLVLYCEKNTCGTQIQDFLELMQHAGHFDIIEEHLMDVGSALSGCGPAYVYQFIEALSDGAVACGLPRQKAIAYAAQTLVGAASMVLETGKHPGALKDAVCSPGGSTIQGVRALEAHGLRSAAMEAVIAACEKNSKLGK